MSESASSSDSVLGPALIAPESEDRRRLHDSKLKLLVSGSIGHVRMLG